MSAPVRFRIEPGTAQTTKVWFVVEGHELDVSAMFCKAVTEAGHPAVYLTLIALAEDSIQPDGPPATKPVIEGVSLHDEFSIGTWGAPA